MTIGDPDPGTFCVAPWFQIRNQNDMSKNVCGSRITDTCTDLLPLDYLNSAEIQDLKQDLHAGIKNKSCSQCWAQESHGVASLRQKLNGILLNNTNEVKNTWVGAYFKKKTDYTSDFVAMADIKTGNTCNFACVMCSPEDSSKIYTNWAQDTSIDFIQEKLVHDPGYLNAAKSYSLKNTKYLSYINDVLSNADKLQWLKFLGGEPLLDTVLLEKVQSLPAEKKKKISLSFVTNGSVNLKETADYLGEFKNIYFCISLEGTSATQDYARAGSNWNAVEHNILSAVGYKNTQISIVHTLQTVTVLGLDKLLSWGHQHNLEIALGYCSDPSYLSFKSLTPPARAAAKLILNKTNLANIIDDVEFDSREHQKFINYISWYENANKPTNSLKNLYPLLFEL
jgi:molybdenum cofactor biosynthesis enzyme MoaA